MDTASKPLLLKKHFREFVAHRRVTLNQFVFIFALAMLTHPRYVFFFMLGFMLALGGAFLRIWAKGTLDKDAAGAAPRFSASGAPGAEVSGLGPAPQAQRSVSAAQLTTWGPYRFLRHPMYAGTLIEGMGACVACFSIGHFLSFVLLAVLILGYFLLVYKEAILLEEEELALHYGSQWDRYARGVPALLPEVEALKTWQWQDLKSFSWPRFEQSGEWRNFLIFFGIFALLWFKLVYRL